MSEVRLVCPQCKSADGLWATASFEGWHSVDVVLEPIPTEAATRRVLKPVRRGSPYYEVTGHEGYDLEAHEMGCTCGWEGQVQQLLHLGLDGKALPEIHPEQERLV